LKKHGSTKDAQKNKNIRDLYRGINEFKRGYQPRNNLVKDEKGDMLADSHCILNRWKNYFSKFSNVHNVSDVGQIKVHIAEPLVSSSSRLVFEIAIAKLKKYKLPGTDQILAELIQAGGEILLSAIHKLLILFGIRKNCLISGRSILLYQFTKRTTKLTNNYHGISLLSTSCKILSNILFPRLSLYIDEIIGDHQCGF
jgi:hypothetical protein